MDFIIFLINKKGCLINFWFYMNIGLSLVYENEVCPCFIIKEGHTSLFLRSHKRGTDLFFVKRG